MTRSSPPIAFVIAAAAALTVAACDRKVDPLVTCDKFVFRVKSEEQIKQARQLMHQLAIDMPGDFSDELPRWGVRATIQVPMSSSRFVLSSNDGPYADKYQFTVLHIAGGTPSLEHNPGREGECTTREIVSEFSKVRRAFLEKWRE
jgi:hypothetical protein